MTIARLLNKLNAAGSRPLTSIATAGIAYSLGLNWLMSEHSRCQQRCALSEIAERRPAVSALTFAVAYLLAACLLMLATAALSMLFASLAGAWSNPLTVLIGVSGIAARMMLVLRSLRQT